MKSTLRVILMVAVMFVLVAGSAFAQDKAVAGMSAWAVFLGAGLAIGLAALGCGIGMGTAIGSALDGTSRNPSVSSRIMTTMMIGLALIESLAIYALVVALLLLFVV